jgi:LPS-assembly protein
MSRGDIYYAVNRGGDQVTDKNKTRLFPMANVMTSYPLTRGITPDLDMIIEPIASITLVPRLDRQNDLPNEDSQDSQLDSSNIFNPNRFPGLDRVEDRSRTTYGGRTSLNWHDGRIAEVFLGQSYRFEDDSSIFPRNSGLSERKSDYVGRLKYVDNDLFTLDYGFQLDQKSLNSVRHEIDNQIKLGRFNINTGYLFAKTIEGVGVTESREQIQSNIAYRFQDDWQARVGGQYDLGEDPGLRKSVFGIDYLGQCLTFSTTIERNLTRESTGDSGTEMMIRVGLKNLGEFQTSGIGLSSSVSDNKTVN